MGLPPPPPAVVSSVALTNNGLAQLEAKWPHQSAPPPTVPAAAVDLPPARQMPQFPGVGGGSLRLARKPLLATVRRWRSPAPLPPTGGRLRRARRTHQSLGVGGGSRCLAPGPLLATAPWLRWRELPPLSYRLGQPARQMRPCDACEYHHASRSQRRALPPWKPTAAVPARRAHTYVSFRGRR